MLKCLTLAAVLLFSIGSIPGSAQKQRFTEPPASGYPLKFYVTHSFVMQDAGMSYLHLVGVLDGADMELIGGLTGTSVFNMPLLPTGDYSARLIGEDAKKDGSKILQYDLLLANGQHEAFTVVGLSE